MRYQVTFANEESAWTRKRNADFLALQLKVQQANGSLKRSFQGVKGEV